MFEKLAARFRSSDTDYRLLVPLLISTMLVQLVTAMVRVTTSYRAVELNLSIVWLGLIAATFAICPILIAVRVGRQIDRGYDAQTTWLGAAIFADRLRGLCVRLVAGGAAGRVRRHGHRPHHADGEPADAVRARGRPAQPGIGVRQLHGGRRHRPGRRTLCGRLGRRRRRGPADATAVHHRRGHRGADVRRRRWRYGPAPTSRWPRATARSFRSARSCASPGWSAWCWRA